MKAAGWLKEEGRMLRAFLREVFTVPPGAPPRPAPTFGQEVEVVEGFYKGAEGVVLERRVVQRLMGSCYITVEEYKVRLGVVQEYKVRLGVGADYQTDVWLEGWQVKGR